MLHWIRRLKFGHDRAPQLYSYSHPEQPNNGAQEFVFHTSQETPLFLASGNGILTRALNVFQPSQVRVAQFNTLAGMPVAAGQLYSQPLIDNPAIQE